MKKIIFILFVVTCLLQISCSNQSKSNKTDKVCSQDTLTYFTENLPTYANVNYLYEFSKKSCYDRFNIKDDVVYFYDHKNMITVLDFYGNRIGDKFDTFTIVGTSSNSTYYLGTNYQKKYYYFPKENKFISPISVLQTPNDMCFITENELLFYTFDGNYKWQSSCDGYIIHIQNNAENIFLIAKPNSINFDIYNTNGEKVEQLNQRQINRLLYRNKAQFKTNNVTYIVIDKYEFKK